MLWLIKIYSYTLGLMVGSCCRFTPSCSMYATEALQKYGFTRGCWLIVKRLLRCHPMCDGGYDPVP